MEANNTATFNQDQPQVFEAAGGVKRSSRGTKAADHKAGGGTTTEE